MNMNGIDETIYTCRICLNIANENEILSVFDVAEKIMAVTSINISNNDDLPGHICKTCHINANTAYHFKILCESSDKFLRCTKINNIKTDKIDQLRKTERLHDQDLINKEIPDSDNEENIEESASCELADDPIYDKNPHKSVNKCELCGKEFATKRKLSSHFATHRRKGSHLCQICGKQFTLLENLDVHQRRHAGIKPHKCSLCEKSFTLNYELKSHMLSHSKEKSYLCNICGNKYTRSVSLEVHTRRMHRNTGRNFSCIICQRSFKDKHDLGIHKLIHSGSRKFECRVCKKAFNRNSNLKVHERIHTGCKPYSCQICKKSFTQKHVLTTHLKIHSDAMEIKHENYFGVLISCICIKTQNAFILSFNKM